MLEQRRTLSLNGILSIANGVVFLLIIQLLFFGSEISNNAYIDEISLLLGLFLCIQTHFFLRLESKSHDPFVLVLAYVTSVYYSLRIVTLTYYPHSEVFTRIGLYSPNDSNFALLLIILSNASLVAGLSSHKIGLALSESSDFPGQPKRGIVFLGILVFLSFSNTLASEGPLAQIAKLIFLFFNPITVFLICAVYIFVYKPHISNFYKKLLMGIALLLIAFQTLGGSRSGFLTYIHYLFFLTIVLVPDYRIKLRTFSVAISLMPAFLALLISIFVIATISRGDIHGQDVNLSTIQKIEIIKGVVETNEFSSKLDEMRGLIFARIGYFDFTSEVIAHRNEYSDILSIKSYIKSIIDNVLTPGFDVFDFPKIGNGLSQIYYGADKLSKLAVSETYQSDQISLFGELFSLVGYFSFAILFLVGRTLKIVYSNTSRTTTFGLALKRTLLVIFFHSALLSFGLDWLLLDIISLSFGVFVTRRLFFGNELRLARKKRTSAVF